MANPRADELTATLKDAAQVAVGLGVLAFQRAQVRRRELEQHFGGSKEQLRTQVGRIVDELEIRLEPVAEVVDAQLDDFEQRLPPPARAAVHSVRSAAREAGAHLRNSWKDTGAA